MDSKIEIPVSFEKLWERLQVSLGLTVGGFLDKLTEASKFSDPIWLHTEVPTKQ